MAATEDLDALGIKVGRGTTGRERYRTRRVEFEGYSQRVGDGLNSQQQRWTVLYDKLVQADYNTLIAFFRARGATEAFLWTPPLEAAQLQWTIAEDSLNSLPQIGSAAATLRLTFVQEFDL